MDVDGPQFYATVPITLHRDGARSAEVIGSAIMARLFGRGVLLTAAHVLDEEANGTLFYPAVDRFVPVGAKMYCSGDPNRARETDDLDIGYVDLGPDSKLTCNPSVVPLERSDLQEDKATEGLNGYTFVGFPWRKCQRRGPEIRTAMQRYTGTGLTTSQLIKHGLDPMKHIAIHFHRHKSSHGDQNLRAIAPLPHGLSGGGIYARPKAPKGLTSIPNSFPLVGIAHSYLESDSILVGTKNEFFLSAIRKNHSA